MYNSEEELIKACIRREPAAEKQLYHRIAPFVYGICLRYAHNETDAKDILQTGFIRFFQSLDTFRFEGEIEAWARRLFVNVAINYYEQNLKHLKTIHLEEDMEILLVDDTILPDISTREMLTMVQQLPLLQRTIFNLYVIEEYTHVEIAGMLGMTVVHSRAYLYRAKQALRKMFQSYEP